VYPLLGGSLRARSVVRLVLRHPRTFLRLLAEGGAAAGEYEISFLGYREKSYSVERQGLGGLRLWTSFRSRVLSGWRAYGLGAVILVLLFLDRRARISDPGHWRTFFWLGSLGFFLASLSQIVVAVLGEGPVELVKLLYFANLLFDVHLLLGLGGLALAIRERLARRSAASVARVEVRERGAHDGLARGIKRILQKEIRLVLLPRRVRVPAAGQVSGERASLGEVVLLGQEPRHHSGDLADLHVLEA
jgi:hypothetical protein